MTRIAKAAAASVAGIVLSLGVVGCTPDHPQEVPAGAKLVSEGDRDVLFTTPSKGTVYIYDQQSSRLVWTGDVGAGKQVKVDRPSNRVLVDDKLVVNKLEPYHNEQVFFQPASGSSLTDSNYDLNTSNQSSGAASPTTQPSSGS